MRTVRSPSRLLRSIVLGAALVSAGCSSLALYFGGGVSDDLRANGRPARARILEVWDTGWSINDDPVIGMKVLVLPSDRPEFEATIEKTTVSRIAVAQFQPGLTVPVRYDPRDPTVVAVDFEESAPPTSPSGNPYHDRYEPAVVLGRSLLPPPAAPQLYLGTADTTADALALIENGHVLIGGARVENGWEPQRALEQGTAVGAALVVVYGHVARPAGATLEVLPFRPRASSFAPPAGAASAGPGPLALAAGLGPGDQFAAYWGKTPPPILGIVSRPLTAEEQARMQRTDGIAVEGVAIHSPAAEAGLAAKDVLIAIDGQPFTDPRAVNELVGSRAGQRVTIDLIRDGTPMSVSVDLNPAQP